MEQRESVNALVEVDFCITWSRTSSDWPCCLLAISDVSGREAKGAAYSIVIYYESLKSVSLDMASGYRNLYLQRYFEAS